MKTLKKLFSVSAIVALLGTLAPMYAFGATYTAELEEAYNYAYKNGITTMTSIDNANMFGSLTRIAMAKMIANYATTVLGLEPDTSAKCTFTDVTAALDAQYDNGVTKACQLGLMGQNITAFRPNDPVTRAEFGTTLSRALNSNDADKLAEMNAADPYYKEHLNFLKNEGIMTQIDNPSMTEVRGYVMLMMMRADESYTPAEGCTAEELLACTVADDIDACMAACNGDEGEEEEEPVEGRVEQGTLKVSLASVQPSEAAIIGVPAIEVGTLKLTAGDEDVNLYSISLEGMGTIPFASITNVALQNKDGVKVTRTKDLNGKGEAKISFVNDFSIKAGGSETLTIIATVAGGTNGQTVAFKVTDFEGPEKVNGTPVTTQYVSMTQNSNIGKLNVIPNTADTTKVKLGEEATLGKFSVKPSNKNEDLVIKSVTIKQNGTIKTSYLDDLYLTVNGKKVSSNFTMDRDSIVFTTNIELDKTDNSNVDVVLKGTVTEGLGNKVSFQIEEAGDIIVEGGKYGTRVNVIRNNVDPWPTSTPVALNTAAIDVQGTAISVSFDKTDTESTLATSNANFGTLKLKAESSDYTFDKMFLLLNTACTNGDKLSDVNIVDVTLGGDSYVGTPTCAGGQFSIEFDDIDLDAGVSRNLPLVIELEEANPTKTYSFDIELNDNEILTDVENDKTYHSATAAEQTEMNKLLSATSFTTRTITVEEGGLTITATTLKNQDVVLANNKEVTFGMGQLKVTNVEDILLKTLTIDGTADYTDKNDNPLKLEDVASKAYLTVDGTKYQGEIDGNKVRFTETVELAKGTTTDFELSLVMKAKDIKPAHCDDNTSTQTACTTPKVWITNTSTFNIVAYTYKVGNNTVEKSTTATPTPTLTAISLGAGFTLVTVGTLAIDENVSDNYTNIDRTVLAGSSDVVLGRFKVNATQENVKVKKLTVNVTDTTLMDNSIKDSLTNVRLATLDGETFTTIPATLTTAEDGTDKVRVLTFDDMNYIAEKATTQYIYLVTDVNAIDQTAAGLTEAKKLNVTVALDTTATNHKAIGESSNEDITPTFGTLTSSKTTAVRANMPASIELLPVNLTLGDSVLVGKVKITMADQSVNKDDEGVLKAILNKLNITVKGVGSTTTATLVGFRKDGSSNTIAVLASMEDEDKELEAGQEVIYNIYADVASTAETPRVQISVSNVNTDIEILDQSGTKGVATKLNIGNGITPEMSVTSSMN